MKRMFANFVPKLAVAATVAIGLWSSTALAQNTVTIGHFGNPTPFQTAVASGAFEEATGWTIDFRKFNSGAEVIAAMASGDIKLSELGSPPLAIALSQGVDLEMFLVAEAYSTAESLIVRDAAGIEKPEDLKGKRVAVPVGSSSHFLLMGALKNWGIDASEVQILNMPPEQIVAAWQQDAIDAAFVWEPAQTELRKNGTRMTDAGTLAGLGYPSFDGWVVNKKFAEENPDFMAGFIRVTDEANKAYLADPSAWTPDSEPVQAIAKETGASSEQIPEILSGYILLGLEDQVSPAWMGEMVPKALKETAVFLKDVGRINALAPDYESSVNVELAKSAMK